MKCLIDTNILYRITKVVPEGKYSRKKLLGSLKNYEIIIVSELSIYELFTRFRLNLCKIKKVIKFISKNNKFYKLRPHPIEGFEPLEIVELVSKNPCRCSQIIDIYARVFAKKIFIEFNIIKYLIEALIVTFGIIIDESNPNKLTINNMANFMQTIYVQITSFRDTNCSQLRTILIKFYSDNEKQSWLKNEIEQILLPCLFTLSMQYILLQHGLNLTNADRMNENENKIISEAIENNNVIMNIMDRLNKGTGSIFERVDINVVERSLNMYEREMMKNNKELTSMNKENVLYYKELLKRIFLTGKKIEKNDIIDSEFLRYFYKDDIEIVSLDSGFRNIVREFDKSYAQKMDNWERSVLK